MWNTKRGFLDTPAAVALCCLTVHVFWVGASLVMGVTLLMIGRSFLAASPFLAFAALNSLSAWRCGASLFALLLEVDA